jgi:Amt family ammonium transporter
MKRTIGIRVDKEIEDMGLDLGEHGEAAYADEEEFRLTPDDYPTNRSKNK